MDVSSDADVEEAVKTVVDAEGRVDIVVNNAGVICIGTFSSKLQCENYVLTVEVISLRTCTCIKN